MSDQNETITFLILKYGSMSEAFSAWVENSIDVSEDEYKALLEYSKKKYDNFIFSNLNHEKG